MNPFINLFSNYKVPQQMPFLDRIKAASKLIADADYVVIGAGAGLSTAAGLNYGGAEFQQEFQPWIERYGMEDLYSSAFYDFATEEEYWAYWAKHIWFTRYRMGSTSLYQALLQLVNDKDYFVLTTNVDAQFLKAGFDAERLFYTQGDYAYLQDAEGEDKHLYYDEDIVKEMLANIRDCRIPAELIPRHPLNGHAMKVNLRSDNTFVEDEHWHEMQQRYQEFMMKAYQGRIVFLEFGVGFNTPVIIRFPFERMAEQFSHAALIRFNKDYPQLTKGEPHEYICFQEKLDEDLIKLLKK